jgi:hypothetical protein
MTKRSMNDLNTPQLREHDRCQHARQGRAAVPEKFSYPKKPVTICVPVIYTPCRYTTEERLGDTIRYFSELAGFVPFDWEHISPAVYVVYFGFDTVDAAVAVQAKFEANECPVIILTEAEEREIIRRHLEQVVRESDDRLSLH